MKLTTTFRQALPLVVLGLALRPSSANPGNDNDGSEVRFPPSQVPDQSQEDPGNRYIVKYANEEGHGAIGAIADKVHKELGWQNAVAAEIKNPQAIVALSNNPNILSLEVDPPRFLVGFRGVRSGGGGTGETASDAKPSILKEARRLAESLPYGIPMVQADQLAHTVAGRKKVCIIDSGYALGHEDLPTTDVVTGSPDGGAGSWDEDGCKHGTHVAGTVAALGGNTVGVRGVIENDLELHIVKVFDNQCRWSYASDLIGALEACRNAGASIVSMSLGGSASSPTEDQAFQDAFDNSGIISIAAAGNDGNTAYSYPASYSSVVSVGAVDSTETIASFSQQNDQVELSAPGVNVYSTLEAPDVYAFYSGTSMATPHVSGVAALVWSHHPTCTAQEIRCALAVTALDKGEDGWDSAYGFGIAQAATAKTYLEKNPCGTGGECPVSFPDPPSCVPSGGYCTSHSQCCSGFCRRGWSACA